MRHDGPAIAGLVPFSTIDYPGRLAAVLFTRGCPLRCRYCHNPHLHRRATAPSATGSTDQRPNPARFNPARFNPARSNPSGPDLDWGSTLAWLRRRTGLLDAVVFSGGEPTVQPRLADALAQIRDLGFATGLHSAGVLPERLTRVLPLLDWVGLDVKAPFERYGTVTGCPGGGARASRSLDAVLASGVDYEVRTTVHPALTRDADLIAIARQLAARGVRRWALQAFRPDGCVDPILSAASNQASFAAILPELRTMVPDITAR